MPHPALTEPDHDLAKLGHFLFWGFGRVRDAYFHGIEKVFLRPTPSVGARYPFQAYVFSRYSGALSRGFYSYDVGHHALVPCGGDNIPANRHDLLIIAACYDRIQNRYRHSWSYHDLLLDYGHLLTNLRLASCRLGILMNESPVNASFPFSRPLMVEPFGGFELRFHPR